jgi:V/A-type H+-transporting ATPase subunit G/H
MARPEVLDRIKEAEREADEIIATAESDADERLAEARKRKR